MLTASQYLDAEFLAAGDIITFFLWKVETLSTNALTLIGEIIH